MTWEGQKGLSRMTTAKLTICEDKGRRVSRQGAHIRREGRTHSTCGRVRRHTRVRGKFGKAPLEGYTSNRRNNRRNNRFTSDGGYGEPIGATIVFTLGSGVDSATSASPEFASCKEPSVTEPRTAWTIICPGSSDESETRGRHREDQADRSHHPQTEESRQQRHVEHVPATADACQWSHHGNWPATFPPKRPP